MRGPNQAQAPAFSKTALNALQNPQKSSVTVQCYNSAVTSFGPGPRIHLSDPRRNALVPASASRPPQSWNLADRPKGCPADRSEARPGARPGLRKARNRGLPSDAGPVLVAEPTGRLAPRNCARAPRNHVRWLDARDRRPPWPGPYRLRARIPAPARPIRRFFFRPLAGQRRNHARRPGGEERHARTPYRRARKDGSAQRDRGTNGRGASASDRGINRRKAPVKREASAGVLARGFGARVRRANRLASSTPL